MCKQTQVANRGIPLPSSALKASAALVGALWLAAHLTACTHEVPATPSPTPTPTQASATATATVTPSPPAVPTASPSVTPTLPQAHCTQSRLLVPARLIGASYEDHGYYLVCADGSSVELLTNDGDYPNYYGPSVSPSGTSVAFGVSNWPHIHVLDLHGNVMQDIRVSYYVLSIDWSPDGEYIAYISGKLEEEQLEIVHLSTGTISSSLLPPDFQHPQVFYPIFTDVAWSPDGRYLAVNTSYGHLFLFDVACDPETHRCATERFRRVFTMVRRSFSWAPDSERLAVVYYDPINDPILNLGIIDLQGRLIERYSPTELEEYTSLEPNDHFEFVVSPIWSPDGEEIAFSDYRDIWILSLADHSLRNLTRGILNAEFGTDIAWVP